MKFLTTTGYGLETVEVTYEMDDENVYGILDDGIYATRLEASRVMRAAGGGKDGHDDSLVVYSFTFGGVQEKEWDVVVKVKAKSQAEAEAKAAAGVR